MSIRLSRRRFLQSAPLLAAPLILPGSAFGEGKRPPPSGRIQFGVIGCGTIALNTLGNFLHDERVQVTAVCDVNRESGHYGYQGEKQGGREAGRRMVEAHYAAGAASGAYKGCAGYEDFREMLDHAKLDAVMVCTPDHWHGLMAIRAAAKGVHTFGQKPLSLTIAEGRRMVEAVTRAGITWQTGSQQRSMIYFRTACEYVRNGRIGRLREIRVTLPDGDPSGHRDFNQMGARTAPEPVPEGLNYDLWEGPAPHRDYRPALLPLNWRHNFDYSGGMITDWGAHHLDIVQWALDKDASGPVAIENVTHNAPAASELFNTPTKFSFDVVYEGGLRVKTASGEEDGIEFIGEGGRSIFVNRDKLVMTPEELRRDKIRDDEVRLHASNNHYANFIDGILGQKPTVAPIEAAHRTITIAHLANIAVRLGRASLKWDPVTERIPGDDDPNALLSRPMRAPWTLEG